MSIHETAVVDPEATLADGVTIGPFAVVGPGVTLHEGVVIGPHAVLEGETTIGASPVVHAQACIGGPPQDDRHDGSVTRVGSGERCRIREHVTIHAGSSAGAGVTAIGDDTHLMAGVHVAHDCAVGSRVTVASTATLSAAVQVADQVVIGSLAGLHPNVRIGRLALVGAGALCAQDVPPFTLAQGAAPAGVLAVDITSDASKPPAAAANPAAAVLAAAAIPEVLFARQNHDLRSPI